jgi:hypothetical protein
MAPKQSLQRESLVCVHWAQYFIILVFSLDMIGYGGIALAVGSALVGLFPSLDIRVAALGADSRRM